MLLTFLSTSIGVFIAQKIYISATKRKAKSSDTTNTSFFENIIKFLFPLIFNSIFVATVYFIFRELTFIALAFAVGNILSGLLDHNKLLNDDISVYVDKEFLLMLLIYLPCFSIATAAQDAEKILSNKSYKYTIIKSSNVCATEINIDTLKFIGMTEQTFLFTDLKNRKIHFIKSDSLVLEAK